MKLHIVTVLVGSVLVAACGQSAPSAPSANVASSARTKSYCDQNRNECWFGAQNQARVAQDRGRTGGREVAVAAREPVQPPQSVAVRQVAVLSRSAADTHRVLLADRQQGRPTAMNFASNPKPEPEFKWFAQYLNRPSNRMAERESPAANQLAMDMTRDEAPRRGHGLRFLGGTTGAEE